MSSSPCDSGGSGGDIPALLRNRWGPTSARYGVELQIARGDNAGAIRTSFGNQNNAYRAYIAVANQNPSPSYEIAAAAGQQIYARYAGDPVLSYNNLALNGIGAPALPDRYNEAARQTLLEARVGTVKYDKDGTCRLESIPLAWSPDGGGFYYLSNLFITMVVARFFASVLGQYISNFKFFDPGTNGDRAAPPGSVSLNTIRADCIGVYGDLQDRGYVEDAETFRRNLVVERPSDNPSTLRVVLPVNIGNAVRSISIVNSWTR